MTDAAAVDPLSGSVGYGRFAKLSCLVCSRAIDPHEPALYEYLHGETVDTVRVPAGGWVELPAHTWLIDSFHVDCYDTLLASLEVEDGVRFYGSCPNSSHGISSPRPLSHCPACAAEIAMTGTRQPQSCEAP